MSRGRQAHMLTPCCRQSAWGGVGGGRERGRGVSSRGRGVRKGDGGQAGGERVAQVRACCTAASTTARSSISISSGVMSAFICCKAQAHGTGQCAGLCVAINMHPYTLA